MFLGAALGAIGRGSMALGKYGSQLGQYGAQSGQYGQPQQGGMDDWGNGTMGKIGDVMSGRIAQRYINPNSRVKTMPPPTLPPINYEDY